MNFNETRKMAKGMGINTYRLKKPDIIRAIQRAECNVECFGTERVEYCNALADSMICKYRIQIVDVFS